METVNIIAILAISIIALLVFLVIKGAYHAHLKKNHHAILV